jgi:hypothetical protein
MLLAQDLPASLKNLGQPLNLDERLIRSKKAACEAHAFRSSRQNHECSVHLLQNEAARPSKHLFLGTWYRQGDDFMTLKLYPYLEII